MVELNGMRGIRTRDVKIGPILTDADISHSIFTPVSTSSGSICRLRLTIFQIERRGFLENLKF